MTLNPQGKNADPTFFAAMERNIIRRVVAGR